MKRVKPEEFKGGQLLFRWHKRLYLEQPGGTEIRFYSQRQEDGMYVAVLKRKVYKLPVFLTIAVLLLCLCLAFSQEFKVSLMVTGDLYSDSEVVGLNVRNEESSMVSVSVRLMKDNKAITEYVTLEPGEDVGNVVQLGYIKPGSYNCVLRVKVLYWRIPVYRDYPVLLIVRSYKHGFAGEIYFSSLVL